MTPKKPGAKRGGKKGNKNALKHGIYSQFITIADDKRLKGMSSKDQKDDLAMACVNFKMAMEERTNTRDIKEKQSWDFIAHYWFESIQNIKSRSELKQEAVTEVWTTFVEAVRAANDRQGVKR
jgi:hypothetical protein